MHAPKPISCSITELNRPFANGSGMISFRSTSLLIIAGCSVMVQWNRLRVVTKTAAIMTSSFLSSPIRRRGAFERVDSICLNTFDSHLQSQFLCFLERRPFLCNKFDPRVLTRAGNRPAGELSGLRHLPLTNSPDSTHKEETTLSSLTSWRV